MKRIVLIPTGRLELCGLDSALSAITPFAEVATFTCLPGPVPPLPGEAPAPYDGFTGGRRLTGELKPGERANLDKLVRRMAAELLGDRQRHLPVDMAIVLDDLEVFNVTDAEGRLDAAQPRLVADHIRGAVLRYLAELQAERSQNTVDKMKERLQGCGSFHLVRPMIEAWFFATPVMLAAAGVPAEHRPLLCTDADPEEFQTEDAAFSADQGQDCTAHRALTPEEQKQKENRLPWIKSVPREFHPKAYLSWLCRDPERACCSSYQETAGGVQALKAMSWEALLADPARCHYAGALVADIADFLSIQLPFVRPTAYGKAMTSRFHQSRTVEPVLRNL